MTFTFQPTGQQYADEFLAKLAEEGKKREPRAFMDLLNNRYLQIQAHVRSFEDGYIDDLKGDGITISHVLSILGSWMGQIERSEQCNMS